VNGVQSPIDAYAYQYDAAGNRTIEQSGSAVTTSTYNSLNQMTGRTGGGLLTISGTLNKPGGVIISGTATETTGSNNSFSGLAAVTTGSNNIVISATNVNGYMVTGTFGVNVTGGTPIQELTYDANGNLTYDGTTTSTSYVWDAANRLVKIWYGTVGSSASTVMSYDGMGRRVQIEEISTSGSVTSTKNLVWEGTTICEEKNASGTVTKAYFPQGVRISGSDYFYTRDHLGSIRELMDASGNVQARYSYDPYGRQTQVSGTMSADFGFTGDYYHSASGLCLTVYRAYSPNLGRWINRDPSDDPERTIGPNLYEYATDNPISNIDPTGLDTITKNIFGGNVMYSPTGSAGFWHSVRHKIFRSQGPVIQYLNVCPPDHPHLVSAFTAGGGFPFDEARGGWGVELHVPGDNDVTVPINTTTLWDMGWTQTTMDKLKNIVLTVTCSCCKSGQ